MEALLHRISNIRHLLSSCVIAALLLSSTPSRGDSDDFNDGEDDGWTRYDPLGTGSWSLGGGTYRLQSAVSPAPSQLGPARVGSLRDGETYSQFYVAVDVVAWDNSLDQIFGVLGRVDTPGLGTTRGYGFTYATQTGRHPTGQLELLRIVNEAGTDLATSNFTFQANQSYRLVFTGELGILTGKVFALTDLVNPLVTISGSDGAYTTGGVGLFTYDNSSSGAHTADTTFDNFLSMELPPNLRIEPDSFPGVVRLSWPGWATTYRLERTETLPTLTWDSLGTGVDLVDGRFVFLDDGSPPSAFYRLANP
jgi:hypothetical protein